MKRFRILLVLLGLLSASKALADLQIYEVDSQYREEVFRALRGVLTPENGLVAGQIQMLPTGQILIDTNAQRHGQIAAILEEIASYQAEATPRVMLRYWAVLGSHEAQQNLPATAETAVPPVLSDVLAELERVHGDLEFRLIGNASLVSESGQEGNLSGNPLTIRQTARVQGSTLNASLSIDYRYTAIIGQYQGNEGAQPFTTQQMFQQSIRIDTSIAANEFVVVGESTVRPNTSNAGEIAGTIFFIVHWPVAE